MSPVYDCELVKGVLETSMGIPEENIILLVDDGETTEETLPTKDNIEVRQLSSFYHINKAFDDIWFQGPTLDQPTST